MILEVIMIFLELFIQELHYSKILLLSTLDHHLVLFIIELLVYLFIKIQGVTILLQDDGTSGSTRVERIDTSSDEYILELVKIILLQSISMNSKKWWVYHWFLGLRKDYNVKPTYFVIKSSVFQMKVKPYSSINWVNWRIMRIK